MQTGQTETRSTTRTAADIISQIEDAQERGNLPAVNAPRPTQQGRVVVQRTESAAAKDVSLAHAEMSHDDMGAFFGAMASAQAKFGPIERTMHAKIRGKSRSGSDVEYGYDYAPLDEVLGAVRPALSEAGLALMQFPMTRGTVVIIRTLIGHTSGQRMWNDLTMSAVSAAPQDIAGAISYGRRYAVQSILGISPDTDDDGGRATGRDQTVRPRQAQPPPQGSQSAAPAAGSSGETAVKILAIRPVKHGGVTMHGIKTTDGEVWCDDSKEGLALTDACRALMQSGTPVVARADIRKGARGQYKHLVELVQVQA